MAIPKLGRMALTIAMAEKMAKMAAVNLMMWCA
jgi:hypothetical protein